MKKKISEIKIGKRIRKDYGDLEGLAQSIKEHSLLQPIVITPDGTLIAGERRLEAVKLLGWMEIEVNIATVLDREEQLLCEIAENEKRKEFTPSERVAYGEELEQIEKLKANERKKATQFGNTVVVDRPSPEKGKTDEIVGKKVGMSGSSYKRAKKVVESGNEEVIEQMDSGKIGIQTAYDKINKPKKPRIEKVVEQEPEEPEEEKPILEKEVKPNEDQTLLDNRISINHKMIEDMVDNFLYEANRYANMTEYIPNLPYEEKRKMLLEIERVFKWYERFTVELSK